MLNTTTNTWFIQCSCKWDTINISWVFKDFIFGAGSRIKSVQVQVSLIQPNIFSSKYIVVVRIESKLSNPHRYILYCIYTLSVKAIYSFSQFVIHIIMEYGNQLTNSIIQYGWIGRSLHVFSLVNVVGRSETRTFMRFLALAWHVHLALIDDFAWNKIIILK